MRNRIVNLAAQLGDFHLQLADQILTFQPTRLEAFAGAIKGASEIVCGQSGQLFCCLHFGFLQIEPS